MNLEPKIIELLHNRGLQTEEEIKEFVSPRPQLTHDPFLLHNMEEGVDFLLSAIDEGKRICIYGDYDADGITSTVILTEVLSELTENLTYYIPSRFDEGYGLNKDAIDAIKSEGSEFIITVDCGSVSVEEVEYAKSLGLDIMVTDHHTVKDQIADCIVINPAQPDCHYPCPYLAGCGVAFKLAQAITSVVGLPKSVLSRTLDMVGIGTIGDIVPLVGENRTLAKYGLRAINTSERQNLAKLIQEIGLEKGHITAEDVSFRIVPHLNAAGRMVHARLAADMFLSKDSDVVKTKIDQMIACNVERKATQEHTFREGVNVVEQKYARDRFLLIELPEAHEGITGIVAGKLKDKYYRPTAIVTPTADDCYKGTGRSIEGINLYDTLAENRELFERFGGHKAACGFTLRKEHIAALRESLNAQLDAIYAENPDIFVKKIEADLELDAQDVTKTLLDQLQLFEPCGNANPRPLVSLCGTISNVSRMGKEGQYLRFQQKMQDGRWIKCVVFHNVDAIENAILSAPSEVHVIGTLKENVFNGRSTIDLLVEHVVTA